MPGSEIANLPAGWLAYEVANGLNLQVSSTKRKYLTTGGVILAALAALKTATRWSAPTPNDALPWLGLTVLLSFFAFWCAFGKEWWHLERNCLVHRIGLGGWAYSRSYKDAELQLAVRYNRNFNGIYLRLYVLAEGKRHFLLERKQVELEQLANFIATQTGWRILRW